MPLVSWISLSKTKVKGSSQICLAGWTSTNLNKTCSRIINHLSASSISRTICLNNCNKLSKQDSILHLNHKMLSISWTTQITSLHSSSSNSQLIFSVAWMSLNNLNKIKLNSNNRISSEAWTSLNQIKTRLKCSNLRNNNNLNSLKKRQCGMTALAPICSTWTLCKPLNSNSQTPCQIFPKTYQGPPASPGAPPLTRAAGAWTWINNPLALSQISTETCFWTQWTRD